MSEEDTVTVGQDLIKLELGDAPAGGKKEAAPEKTPEPAAEKPKESAPEPAKPKEKETQTQASKPAAPEKPKETPKAETSKPALGNREERRVRFFFKALDGCEKLKTNNFSYYYRSR